MADQTGTDRGRPSPHQPTISIGLSERIRSARSGPARPVHSLRFEQAERDQLRPAQLAQGRTINPANPSDLIRCGSASLEPLRASQGGLKLSLPIIGRRASGAVMACRLAVFHSFIESSQYWGLQWAHPSLIMASDGGRTHRQEFNQEE